VSARRSWWLAGATLGTLFALFSLVELAFVDGDSTRDLVGIGLGGLMVAAALVRYRGSREGS
jgi:hypothetical protein